LYSNNEVVYHHDSILVENANVWGVLKVPWFFGEGPIKVAHYKKRKKKSFEMHPQLINMNLQESMAIKDI
jgi:hypothetical protein